MPQHLQAEAAIKKGISYNKDDIKKSISQKVLEALAGNALGPIGTVAEFEPLLQKGLLTKEDLNQAIKATTNSRGFHIGHFLDKDSDFYNIGSDVHEKILLKSGLLDNTHTIGESEMAKAMRDANLIRLRSTPNITGLELSKNPSDSQLDTLIKYFQGTQPKQIATDFWKPGDYSGGHFTDVNKMLSHLIEYFSK